MSSAVVFVFLLGNLTGIYKNLNESIHANLPLQTNSTIEQCSTSSEDIISAISQQLGLQIVPEWRTNVQRDVSRQTSPESLQNIGTYDNSLLSEGSFEKETNLINETYRRKDTSGCSEEMLDKDDDVAVNSTKVQFPKEAPFLVAIFETVSNVTAQTCAGSLVSPRWVLTAASCVNLLAHLYDSDPNSPRSHYTIVAGSTDPLSDGTVHNVTSVLLHPDPGPDSAAAAHDRTAMGPFLAMMRIEPEIAGDTIEVVGGEVKDSDVMVYGWVLSKNESGHNTLSFTSSSARLLPAAECKALYSYRNNDVLCLADNHLQENITQLSTGGPVLAVHKNEVKMLAVAQTDDHLFVAYSLTAHLKWIKTILNDID